MTGSEHWSKDKTGRKGWVLAPRALISALVLVQQEQSISRVIARGAQNRSPRGEIPGPKWVPRQMIPVRRPGPLAKQNRGKSNVPKQGGEVDKLLTSYTGTQ